MSGARRSSKRKATVELPGDARKHLTAEEHSSRVDCIISSSSNSATPNNSSNKRITKARTTFTSHATPASVIPISTSSLQVADQPVTVAPMPAFSAATTTTSSSSPNSFPASSIEEWRTFLRTNGYIFLHDVLPRELVIEVRNLLLTTLESRNLIHPQQQQAHSSSSVSEAEPVPSLPAKAVDTKASPNFLTDLPLQQTPQVQQLLEHPRLAHLIHQLIEPNTNRKPTEDKSSETNVSSHLWTSNYKWLRGVGQGCCTGFHLDRVYMSSRPRPQDEEADLHKNDNVPAPLYSCWLPIGDISQEQGCLVISPGSHVNEQFERLRTVYGSSSVGTNNGTTSGWIQIKEFTDQPVKWVSSAAPAGSIVLLDLSVLHGTSVNTSDEYRLSCDTRWTTAACPRQRTATSDATTDSTRCGSDCEVEPPATIRFKRIDY